MEEVRKANNLDIKEGEYRVYFHSGEEEDEKIFYRSGSNSFLAKLEADVMKENTLANIIIMTRKDMGGIVKIEQGRIEPFRSILHKFFGENYEFVINYAAL